MKRSCVDDRGPKPTLLSIVCIFNKESGYKGPPVSNPNAPRWRAARTAPLDQPCSAAIHGLTTYPRTETTSYAESFPIQQMLKEHSEHSTMYI